MLSERQTEPERFLAGDASVPARKKTSLSVSVCEAEEVRECVALLRESV